jgi:integrase
MPANPKPRRIPKYRLNSTTDRACVELNGHVHWLGQFGSEESRQKYDRLIAEWLANGRHVPERKPAADVTVIELIARFWEHAQGFYVNGECAQTGEADNYRLALKPLKALYGYTNARDFGPLCLAAVQQKMIELGWCRNVVNRQTGRLKYVFKWAVSKRLFPAANYQELLAVGGLRKGKSEARETRRVRPVDVAHVDAAKAFLPPTVRAMVDLQLLTGMRPTEVCIIRGCDIDTSDDALWVYRPQFHKTEHHAVERVVFLGERAQQIIHPHLKPNPTAYLFSPKDAEAWRHDQAKTHRRHGQKPNPKMTDRALGERYDDNSYRRAVARACAKADKAAREQRRKVIVEKGIALDPAEDVKIVPRWHPNQLRHTAATRLRKAFGLETARVILGHQSAAMTEVYAEQDREKARRIMAQVG